MSNAYMRPLEHWVLRVADSDVTWFGLNWLRPSKHYHIGLVYILLSSFLLGLPASALGAIAGEQERASSWGQGFAPPAEGKKPWVKRTSNDPTPEGKKPWVKKPPVEGKTPWTPRSDAEAAPATAGDKPWKGKPKGGDRPWAAKDARGKPAAPRAPYKGKTPR